MRKNSSIFKNKGLLVAIFVILVGGISLGYAALSATLTINGKTNISKVGWDIHFFNASVTEGSVAGTPEGSIIDSTDPTTASWTATLEEPGDFYEFTLYVGNFGTIDAKLAQLDTDATKKWIKNNMTVTYADGDKEALSAADQAKLDEIFVYTVDDSNLIDALDKANGSTPTSFPLTFKVEFKRDIDGEDLISRPIELNYLYQLKYIQR